ncbi:MAG: DUF4440 domain-containing protein [Myxococcales bacterium]|nr:DUF4440 domain-containing protein [Myxococcales bacterium]
MTRIAFGIVVAVVVAGLGAPSWAEESDAAEAVAGSEADPAALLAEQLLAADRAWSETPPDAEAFASFFAAGGRLFPPGAPLVEGREAIARAMRPAFESPGYSLAWKATAADISESGDLGFTFGTFEQKSQDSAGATLVTIGKYVTVWRRGSDHTWRVVADIFNADG